MTPPNSSIARRVRIIGDKPNFTGPGPQVIAAESLQGEKVLNPRGERLGEIEAIMLDVPTGRIVYAVLAHGGIMGIGDKLFAIPWEAFTLDAERRCLVLDVDEERLRRAPGFDKAHWPSMADPTWSAEIHDYYRGADSQVKFQKGI
jgi:sporulation protein YlmC with PRC-barrel domain